MAGKGRADALSKQRIIENAIEILDADGQDALTFRALAARLSTGSGAIYWHVANKDDLLEATTEDVIARALAGVGGTEPRRVIRDIAIRVFDAIDTRPWVGTQLARKPWQSAMLRIFEGIGGQFQAMGIPEPEQFDCASALVGYILGLAAQYSSVAGLRPGETDRSAFLDTVAAQWTRQDPDDYPFVHRIAAQLREHDDREQFLFGIDLILASVRTER
ncbi:TetR family transcriptional regulator [Mycobacterium sp. ITM-2016-00316]|uniref:TetR family transcriptional regulator n=1 Tax=Mycobacterium sp. ITM-2016-00316 TaxID=2099695 RepID=UPI0018EDF565|nr:TetR family transcriptional regulator [Mycobacterium sp. ITM-2016-00316]WNG84466.1 TetR family transcriptional regulator [Mycobacterium sp. ITM-2016-00316]